ncbi:MAG: circularly permuted type 2 ATP-grasp protein, partial [Phycisphaeraceae bacterium]
MLRTYRAKPGITDQLFDERGGLRGDWSDLAEQLRRLPPETMEHRRANAQRVLDDNGILLTGPHEFAQPHLWPLDPIPFQLGADHFASLSVSLAQRAALLNLVAADLLGPQRVIKEKVLPPALLYANPHYRQAYHDLPVAGGRYIHLYAADVTCGDGGRWWVQGDRTQAPSGLGFTLENRIAIARAHGEWFDRLNVQRHARFFQRFRQTLSELATSGNPNPHIVLLSEGPTGHRGFEDAYLARYLGYTLTVGQDLAVRRNQTVLKTLGGPMPVEVILRRINDDACDPVELSGESRLGVAGLVESQRQEKLSIANMLGSQLVESPALSAFLEPMCQFFFGEDLKLPTVATWWCGQKPELAYVLDNLASLYIYPAFQAGTAPIDPAQLTSRQRMDLADQIRLTPERYVAQQRLRRGTSPVWTGEVCEPWHWALRMFTTMNGDSYDVLPGGLVRLAQHDTMLDFEPSQAERTQDCWVKGEGPPDMLTLLPPSDRPLVITRSGAELPSRVADNLYWLGRTMEAAESQARLIRALITHIERESSQDAGLLGEGWQSLLSLLDQDNGDAAASIPNRLKQAILGAPAPGNLRQSIRECVRLAQSVRDRISVDAWRVVARMERYVLQAAATSPPDEDDLTDVSSLLNHLILELVAFGGLMSESMTRTLGWRFLDLGRRMERARRTAELLQLTLVDRAVEERPMLETLLDICDSAMTY